ncbi:MAG TPA: hypothetical protein VIW67_13610 [Terriglobales bacterium]|jgi:hypothetical protein
MKRALIFIFVFFSVSVSYAQVISKSYLFDGTTYEFSLSFTELGDSPSWSPTDNDPPLSPKKAVEAAKTFLLSLTGDKIDWRISTIKLHKYHERDSKWVYFVQFDEMPRTTGVYDGPVQVFEVVVYMTGKVIEPQVTKKKS